MHGSIEPLVETVQTVQSLVDRGDESAEEINDWVASKIHNGVVTFGSGSLARQFKPVYFHNMKIFQIEEARDVSAFRSDKTFMTNKVIVEYTYHIPQDFNNTPKPSLES
jgi:hypothetical protein